MRFTHKAVSALPLALAVALAGCSKDEDAAGFFGKSGAPNDVVSLGGAADLGEPPVVTIGGATTVDEGSEFAIKATLGEALTQTWSQVSGPTITITTPTKSNLNLVAPKVNEDSVAVLRLTAVNDYGVTTADVRININNVPVAPTAFAGDDITVLEGATASIQATASVVAGEPAVSQYRWEQISGPNITLDDNSATPSFTAPEVAVDSAAVFRFTAIGAIESTPDEVTINIINKTPTADAGTLIEVVEGETFTLDGSASLANGDRPISQYVWRSENTDYPVTNDDATVATRTLTAKGVDANQELQFALSVADGTDTSAEDFVTVRVLDGGDKPVAIASDITVPQQTPVSLDATPSTEPQNRALSFNWSQVLADGENAIDFTISDDGSKINFTSPAIDADKNLTFRVTAFNGFNYSDPETVTVKVIAEEVYSGERVKLKGNPYTVIGDKLDLGVTPYSIEVVGNHAYITYHELKKNDAGIQPTGLLVVDISDDRAPKVVKDYPVTWDGRENVSTVQLRLAVDAEEKFAYIVEKNLLGADGDEATGVLRIDLSQAPVDVNNGVQLQKATEDSDGEQFSDIVYRGGELYALEYSDYGAIYRLTTNAETGASEFTSLWAATTGATDGNMGTLDVSADGKVAVVADLYDITVIHFADDGSVAAEFEVEATQMNSGAKGRLHVAIEEGGNAAYLSFQAKFSGTNVQPANVYSAVEKIDVRNVADGERLANLRFSSPDQALGLVTQNGMTFVASGQQGLQLLDGNNAEKLSLKTYYQTPMRATDVSVNTLGQRAYIVGDQSLSIADLSSQDTPAMATNWVEEYFENVQAGQSPNPPLSASDVELVEVPNVGTYAVVTQARSDKGSNLLFLDSLGTDTWSINTLDYSSVYKIENKLRLKEFQGDIYTLYNSSGNSGAYRIKNESIASATPVLEKFSPDNAYDIAFINNEIAYLNQGSRHKRWSVVDAKEASSDGILYNVYFYATEFSASGNRILGAGRSTTSTGRQGCWVGDATGKGTTFSQLSFETPDLSVVQAAAITNSQRTCFAGFGYDSKLKTVADRDDYRAKAPFGILAVDFLKPIDQIDSDPDSQVEDWQDLIDPASVARQAIYTLPDNPEEILPKGNRLYVANATFGGVQILNASDPTNLVLEGVLHTEDSAQGLDVTADQSLVIVADDNMRGIVQIPIEFPTIDRTDNDAVTALLDNASAIANADAHAIETQTLTFDIDWTREEYDQVTCYATTDTQQWGNETCVATISDGTDGDATSATLTWTLPAGDIDQEIRVAVGNNIEFLSSTFQVFVDKEIVTP